MFKHCSNLAELNAARIKATTEESADLVAINNAYNTRRQEILAGRSKLRKLTSIIVEPEPVTQYCGIPIAGNSQEIGTITMTANGFLY